MFFIIFISDKQVSGAFSAHHQEPTHPHQQ
jgi:hypothetical protein